MKKLIGLSLSLCAKDILEGKVFFDDVDEFVLGTGIDSLDVMETVFQKYATTYWRDFPPRDSYKLMQAIVEVASQPKLDGCRPVSIGSGQWLEVEVPDVFVCENCTKIVDNNDKQDLRGIALCHGCYLQARLSDCEYAFGHAVDGFDWVRVHNHMVATNHTWQDGDVPSIEMLQVQARMLFRDCVKSKGEKQYSRVSTGGLVVDIVDWNSSSEVRITFPLVQKYNSF